MLIICAIKIKVNLSISLVNWKRKSTCEVANAFKGHLRFFLF